MRVEETPGWCDSDEKIRRGAADRVGGWLPASTERERGKIHCGGYVSCSLLVLDDSIRLRVASSKPTDVITLCTSKLVVGSGEGGWLVADGDAILLGCF